MGFSGQEYWSGLPYPSPGDLPDPGIEPGSLVSLALAGGFFTTVPPGKPSPIKSVMVNILNFVARLWCCNTKATTGNNTCMCCDTAVFQQSFVYRCQHVNVLWFSWVRKYYSPFDLFQPFKNNDTVLSSQAVQKQVADRTAFSHGLQFAIPSLGAECADTWIMSDGTLLPAILILGWASSSLAFHMMYSVS